MISDSNELTLGEIFETCWRRRVTFLLVFAVVLAAGILFWLKSPREYSSEGRLLVQVGRSNFGLDPTTAAKPVSIQDARETEIRSVMEFVRSQAVLQAVVDEVGADRILENPWDPILEKLNLTSWLGGSSSNWEFEAEEYERLKKRELAARQLQKKTAINLEKNSSVISISVKANSPKLAQEIVQQIMSKSCESHMQAHSVSRTRSVFDAEFDKHNEQLQAALDAQSEFRNERGFLSLGSARQTLQGQIDKIEMEMLDVEVNIAQTQRRVEELQQKLGEIDEFLDTAQQGLESSSTEDARSEMFRLRALKTRLLATYQESHPQVEQVNRQIEELQPELDKLPIVRTSTSAVVNPVYASVKVDLVSQETLLESLVARRDSLKTKQQAAMTSLRQLNQDEVISDRLEQDVMIARRYLDVYIQKRGEAQVLEQLDEQSVSDVVIAQPAVMFMKHVSPRGTIVLPLAAIFGIGSAFLVALGVDYLYFRRARTLAKVTQQLEVPVLVSLPRVASRRTVVR